VWNVIVDMGAGDDGSLSGNGPVLKKEFKHCSVYEKWKK
jgi:hypothetical protein